jgi:hypothetical protein
VNSGRAWLVQQTGARCVSLSAQVRAASHRAVSHRALALYAMPLPHVQARLIAVGDASGDVRVYPAAALAGSASPAAMAVLSVRPWGLSSAATGPVRHSIA